METQSLVGLGIMIVSRESQCLPFGSSVSDASSPALNSSFLAHRSCFGPEQNMLAQKARRDSYWKFSKMVREHSSQYSQPAGFIASSGSSGTTVSWGSTDVPFGRSVAGARFPAFIRAFLAQVSCRGVVQHTSIQNCLMLSFLILVKSAHSSRYSQSAISLTPQARWGGDG
jgi:hypothetical protein